MDIPRPTFRDAYIVDHPAGGYAGVVRKQSGTWRVFRLDVGPDQQPAQVFGSREEAGIHLLDLVMRARRGLLDTVFRR